MRRETSDTPFPFPARALPASLACALALAAAAARADVRWDFEDSLLGWRLTHDLRSCGWEDGALCLEVTGGDPYMVGPGISADARDLPYFIARIRVEAARGGEVFFSSSASPGIIAGNSVTFSGIGDGRAHTYTIYMPANERWAGTVDRVRLDPPAEDGTRLWIDWIALASERPRSSWFFEDEADADLWRPNPNLTSLGVAGGAWRLEVADGGASDPWLTGPEMDLPARAEAVFSAGLEVSGSGRDSASLYFITSQDPAWNEAKALHVPIERGTGPRVVRFFPGTLATWRGRVTAVRFDPIASNAFGARVTIDFLAFDQLWDFAGDDPGGWRIEGAAEDAWVEGGAFRFDVTATGARFLREEALDAGAFGALQLRLRCDGGGTWPWRAFFAGDAAPGGTREGLAFPLACDGEAQLVTVDLTANPFWRGRIARIGIEPAAPPPGGMRRVVCEEVRLRPRFRRLAVTRFGTAGGAVFAGERFSLDLEITNISTIPIEGASATLAFDGASLLGGDNPARLPALEPGEAAGYRWELEARDGGEASFEVRAGAPGADGDTATAACEVLPPDPGPGPAGDGARIAERPGGALSIQNEGRAIVFLHGAAGFSAGALYVLRAGEWTRLGLMRPLMRAEVETDRGREVLPLTPGEARVISAGPGLAAVAFGAAAQDAGGAAWTAEAAFYARPLEPEIRAQWSLSPARASRLAGFGGPLLGIGEASFGAEKEAALLPGLEWLEGDEVSSSTLDVRTEAHLRRVPHPYKITVPAVSVAAADGVAGLLWDAEGAWLGREKHPSLVFDCPDRIFGLDRNLLGLFAPSVPDYVRENELAAAHPVRVGAGEEVTLRCRIYLDGAGSVLDPVKRWYEIYGATVSPPPRPFQEALALSLRGLTDVLWDASGPGWAHAAGWPIAPYPAHAALLLYGGSLLEGEPALRAECFRQAEAGVAEAIRRWGAGSLIGNRGAHMPCGELPFLWGYLDEGLAKLQGDARRLRESQQPDGSWSFTGDPALGTPGRVEIGTCARKASTLLRAARLCGDAAAREAGLRALERMRAFTVPRAAQTWEVPVHTPDLLAAAWAVEAFLEGYLATGREDLLEAARDWAEAGLPFIYTWGFAERDVMPGASIPVFGATRYTGSWFARPVQWNGFVYANALYRLWEHDRSFPWRDVALAITRSGFRQQYAAGPHAGLYPDSWDLVGDHPNPVDINPEGLLRNLWHAEGVPFEVTTRAIPTWRGDYYVDAVAPVEPLPDPARCAFRVRWFPRQPVLLQLRGPRVDRVTAGGEELPLRADVDDAPGPGRAPRNAGSWILKFTPSEEETTVTVAIGAPPQPAFRRADANLDGAFDIADAIAILEILFGGREAACLDAADADDDGQLDIADAIALLSYLFARGPGPPPPFPRCGPDPSPDPLGCTGDTDC